MSPFCRQLPAIHPFVWSSLLLVGIYMVGVLFIDGFGGLRTVQAMLLLGTFLGIASAGQTVVILAQGIDLSVPFVIGAANVVVAQLYGGGMPFWLAVLVALTGGGVLGVVQAIVSSAFRVHPLLITFGFGTALLGLVQFWTGGLPAGDVPDWLSSFVSIGSQLGPIPVSPVVVVWVLLAIAIVFVLKRTGLGWRVYAFGSNPRAAELALVKPVRVWAYVFGFSGVLSALAGVLLLGFTGSAFAQVGDPYLFLAIAAVVVGGTAITGGRGGYVGTVIGALVLTVLDLVFAGFGLSGAMKQVLLGVILLILVSVYGRESHVSESV